MECNLTVAEFDTTTLTSIAQPEQTSNGMQPPEEAGQGTGWNYCTARTNE